MEGRAEGYGDLGVRAERIKRQEENERKGKVYESVEFDKADAVCKRS